MSQSTGKKSGPLLRSPAGTRDAKTAPGSHCCLRHLPCCALYGSTLYFKKCVYAEMFLILLILKPIAVDEVISFVWCLLNILLTFDLEITKLYRSLKGKAKNSCFLCTQQVSDMVVNTLYMKAQNKLRCTSSNRNNNLVLSVETVQDIDLILFSCYI